VYILNVIPGSAAEKAGLKQEDVIVKADGESVTTAEMLNDVKDNHRVGEKMELTVIRGGKTMEITVVLGEENPNN